MTRERDARDGDTPGLLKYRLYGQDGRLIEMTCADTPSMREFTEWVRIHDRHTPSVQRTISGGET
jgi:hypothetical protein